jgi:hypothetical protein
MRLYWALLFPRRPEAVRTTAAYLHQKKCKLGHTHRAVNAQHFLIRQAWRNTTPSG